MRFSLIPRETKFFDLFDAASSLLTQRPTSFSTSSIISTACPSGPPR